MDPPLPMNPRASSPGDWVASVGAIGNPRLLEPAVAAPGFGARTKAARGILALKGRSRLQCGYGHSFLGALRPAQEAVTKGPWNRRAR
ncbi:MAG: hypothetical protein ACYDHP_14345 [Ferrimicrobium sp.]